MKGYTVMCYVIFALSALFTIASFEKCVYIGRYGNDTYDCSNGCCYKYTYPCCSVDIDDDYNPFGTYFILKVALGSLSVIICSITAFFAYRAWRQKRRLQRQQQEQMENNENASNQGIRNDLYTQTAPSFSEDPPPYPGHSINTANNDDNPEYSYDTRY